MKLLASSRLSVMMMLSKMEPDFTCHGRMDEHSSSWFCMTGIDRPGFMTPGLLRREGDAARLPAPSVALPALAAALIFAVAAVLFKGSKQRRGAASANLV